MEPKKFDQLIREKIATSDSIYGDLADSAREGIWNKIGKGDPQKRIIWLYAAASILIMMTLSGFFMYSLNKKNALITELTLENKDLKNNKKVQIANTNYENTQIHSISHKTDTVYVTKVKVENNIVEQIKILRDTIYRETNIDSVIDAQDHVEEVKNIDKNALAEINNEGLQTEYIFINQENTKPNKNKEKKRHRLKIGNFGNPAPEPESESLSLLKTNF